MRLFIDVLQMNLVSACRLFGSVILNAAIKVLSTDNFGSQTLLLHTQLRTPLARY